LQAAIIVAALGVLETSLSFDNAVVNARVLQHWDDKWRNRFLTGASRRRVRHARYLPARHRVVATGMNPALGHNMALYAPRSMRHLRAVHHEVAGFGGAFLFLVALGYFLEEKQSYWWEAIESRFTKLGQIEAYLGCAGPVCLAILSLVLPRPDPRRAVLRRWRVGRRRLHLRPRPRHLLGGGEDDDEECEDSGPRLDAPVTSPTGAIIKASIAGFLYLELLDASFSFDGVIGAFVLTDYLPFIALGLGIGAFFVRSMTIHLVEAGKLSEYRYLEAGAFYAIFALAASCS
jgi:hypothetical protein